MPKVWGRSRTSIAVPASENAGSDLQTGKMDSQVASNAMDLKVPEVPTQEAAQKQADEAALTRSRQTTQTSDQQNQTSDQQQLQQIIETDQTPTPAPVKQPPKPKTVEKTQRAVETKQATVTPPEPSPRPQVPAEQPVNQAFRTDCADHPAHQPERPAQSAGSAAPDPADGNGDADDDATTWT